MKNEKCAEGIPSGKSKSDSMNYALLQLFNSMVILKSGSKFCATKNISISSQSI
jgi:hypothetical protein